MKKIGLLGNRGLVGGEIADILEHHDKVKIVAQANTEEQADMGGCDLVFMAANEQAAMEHTPGLLEQGIKVIDTSGAFRLPKEDFQEWYDKRHTAPELLDEAVYGLAIFHEKDIASARLVANPGCYVTAYLIPMKPLTDLVHHHVIVDGISGISGAGKKPGKPNMKTYGYGRKHRHVPEMERYCRLKVDSFTAKVSESVARGINLTVRAELGDALKDMSNEAAETYLINHLKKSYAHQSFIFVERLDGKSGTRDVVHTHGIIIQIGVDNGFLYVCSLIDNLQRGAASQAVENMNLMLGFPRLYGIEKTD